MRKSFQLVFLSFVFLMILLNGCAPASTQVPSTPTPIEPPGTIIGKVVYADPSNGGSAEPMQDVMVVLCRVPAEGLPEGPAVASSNRDETEHICTLLGTPTALTDPDGVFTLDGVPSATYLVMFHLFPDEMEGVEWDGVALMEAYLNEDISTIDIPPSGESGFWEDGGHAIATMAFTFDSGKFEGNWLARGNVCSNKFEFCFSIRDNYLNPVTEVESNETVEIELTAHFKSRE